MADLRGYLFVGGVAAATTFVCTPIVRAVSLRRGWVVEPDERRVHERVTPDVGGMAMLAGLLVAMLVAWRMDRFHEVFTTTEPLAIVLAGVVMYTVGFVDDLREVSAPAKVAGMVLASSCLFLLGVQILNVKLPFLDLTYIPDDLSPLITTLWVIGMANAVNLIDGLDGLAAGIVAIGSATFFAYAYDLIGDGSGYLDPSSSGPLVAIVVCGLCVGFLPWNVHPARIFMGDGGALLLGVLMASSTVVVGGQSGDSVARGQTYFFFAPLFIPLVILGVPVVDTVWAIIRRATRRAGLATADKDHLHHRLMRLGHGHWRSVAILWGWTAALSILVLYPVYNDSGNGVVPFLVVASFLVLYTVLHPEVRRRAAEAPPTADAPPAGDAPLAVDEPLPDRSAPSESDVSDVLPARGPDA